MRIKTKIMIRQLNIDAVISTAMVLLICSFVVFSTKSWGRYVMLACVAVVFMLDVFRKRWKYKVVCGRLLVAMAFLSAYSFISALWAIDVGDAVSMGKTLFEILFMIAILYNCYAGKRHAVRDILRVVKWSSYVVVIYSIVFYGIDTLALLAVTEQRLSNSYANVNTIGMLAAVGILIQLDECLQAKRSKMPLLLCVPSLFMLGMTQSRKALMILLVGFVMIVFLRNPGSKDAREGMIKLVLITLAVGLGLYVLLSLPWFNGVAERMTRLIAALLGGDAADSSSKLRMMMTQIGWEQFLKTPVQGVGMGGAHHVVFARIGHDSYLHNNFIELLAGGGVIGFLLYYAMYFHLFVQFWKYRKYKNEEYIVCLVIMLLLFVMDYGVVSYYTKLRYVYLLLFFLEAESLKRRAHATVSRNRSKKHEDQSIDAVHCGYQLPTVGKFKPFSPLR